MSGAVLDAGALIAFERSDRAVVAIVARALAYDDPLIVPAGVVAQVWRDGGKQARLARLLASPICTVEQLDDRTARAVGQVCGVARVKDIVDVSVVVAARAHKIALVTGDANDVRRIDSSVAVVEI